MKTFIFAILLCPNFLIATPYNVPQEIACKIIHEAQKKYPTDFWMQDCLIKKNIESYKNVEEMKKQFGVE
jgi:hypothetical protein